MNMIHTLYIKNGHEPVLNPPLDQLPVLIKDPEALIWVNMAESNPEEMQSVLSDTFHFHPLSIEDCQSSGYQDAKLDDYQEYLFLVVNAIDPKTSFQSLSTFELDIYLGENYLVTCYTDPLMPPVDFVLSRINRDDRLWRFGPDFLCHAILDRMVDDYIPVFDKMEDEVEWLEDEVVSNPQPPTLERLLVLKHSIMGLRRAIAPLRELMNRLSRDDYKQVDQQSRIYFRDIYDHLVRVQDLAEAIRDIVSGAMDIYLNSTSLRLNSVMKALTIVSTIFLPLTFLAGVYGMNFKYFPELSSPWGYPILWLVFILIVVGMLTYFKRKNWF
jgi:magnesium transporter